jgi:hypothetical protein
MYSHRFQVHELELVTDTGDDSGLASIGVPPPSRRVRHVLSAHVGHEGVQVGTLGQPVVSTQADLGQLALGLTVEGRAGVVNSCQQLQGRRQGVGGTQFIGINLLCAAQGLRSQSGREVVFRSCLTRE